MFHSISVSIGHAQANVKKSSRADIGMLYDLEIHRFIFRCDWNVCYKRCVSVPILPNDDGWISCFPFAIRHDFSRLEQRSRFPRDVRFQKVETFSAPVWSSMKCWPVPCICCQWSIVVAEIFGKQAAWLIRCAVVFVWRIFNERGWSFRFSAWIIYQCLHDRGAHSMSGNRPVDARCRKTRKPFATPPAGGLRA